MPETKLSDLKRWEQAGLIDAETAARIRAFEEKQAGQPGSDSGEGASPAFLSNLLSLFGGVMVVLGLILLLAWQWDVLTPWQQTALSFALLIASLAYAGFSLWKAAPGGGRLHREISAAVWFLVSGAVHVLLSEIWQLPGDTGLWMRSWALITLPMLWLMRSYALSLLMLGLLFALSIFAIGHPDDFWPTAAAWLITALSLPWYLLLLQHSRIAAIGQAHGFALALLPLVLLGTAGLIRETALFTYLALASVMILLGCLKTLSPMKTWLLFWGLCTAAFILTLSSFAFVWEGFELSALNKPDSWLPLLLLFVLMMLLHARHRKTGVTGQAEFRAAALLVLPYLGVVLLNDFSGPLAQTGANLLLLVFGILMMRAGIRQLKPVYLNFGVLLLSFQLLARFFEAEFPVWVRGLGFLAAGLSLLLANRWLSAQPARRGVGPSPDAGATPELAQPEVHQPEPDEPGARERLFRAAIRFGKDLNA